MEPETTLEVDSRWLVEMVNEYSTTTRRVAGEVNHPISPPGGGPGMVDRLSESELIGVADAWFEVFASAPDPERVAEHLNTLIGRAPSTRRAEVVDGAVVAASRHGASTAPRDRLAAAGAETLLDVVAELGTGRVGVCSAGNCADVFIDRSPQRNRRYCSLTCQTRERVRRHRERSRASGHTAVGRSRSRR